MAQRPGRIDRFAQMSKQEEVIAKKRQEILEKQRTAQLAKAVAAAQELAAKLKTDSETINEHSDNTKNVTESERTSSSTTSSTATTSTTKSLNSFTGRMGKLSFGLKRTLLPQPTISEQPPPKFVNTFCNDGSFLENFKKILEKQLQQQTSTVKLSSSLKTENTDTADRSGPVEAKNTEEQINTTATEQQMRQLTQMTQPTSQPQPQQQPQPIPPPPPGTPSPASHTFTYTSNLLTQGPPQMQLPAAFFHGAMPMQLHSAVTTPPPPPPPQLPIALANLAPIYMLPPDSVQLNAIPPPKDFDLNAIPKPALNLEAIRVPVTIAQMEAAQQQKILAAEQVNATPPPPPTTKPPPSAQSLEAPGGAIIKQQHIQSLQEQETQQAVSTSNRIYVAEAPGQTCNQGMLTTTAAGTPLQSMQQQKQQQQQQHHLEVVTNNRLYASESELYKAGTASHLLQQQQQQQTQETFPNDNCIKIPATIENLIALVIENGEDYEDKIRSRRSDLHPSLWFLYNKNCEQYHNYRQQLELEQQYRVNREEQQQRQQKQIHMAQEENFENSASVSSAEKYDPESVISGDVDSDDEYMRSMMNRNRSNLQRRIETRNELSDEERQEREEAAAVAGAGASGEEDKETRRERRKRERKSRWGEKVSEDASTTSFGNAFGNQKKLLLTNITRNDAALLQYARLNYGSTNLSEEDWKKCEEHYKVNLLYQDMMRKRQEIDRLARNGKFKYEYDSDEDVDGGTWEHKLRTAEMEATKAWATALTKQSEGKHHIGDFLPPEELKKFMEQYEAKKNNRQPDLSDYKEYKLREDNIGFQMLQKLGWKEGQGLGTDGAGITDPVNKAPQRDGNQGLGVTSVAEPEDCDNEYDAYRKRMMLAYRFRPNPLNNPRRAYY